MSAFKKPFGWWKAKRLREVIRFTIAIEDLEKYEPNLPDDLLPELRDLMSRLRDSDHKQFEVVLFKISPRVTFWGVKGEIENRKRRPTGIVELLLLADRLPELAGRVVVALGSQWKAVGGFDVTNDFFWGLDFRGGKVRLERFNHEVNRTTRTCFAYTTFSV